MKKVVFALALVASTATLFSFKSANTASVEMTDMKNYQINQQNTDEFLALYKEYQENGNEPLAIPTCNLLRAGLAYARAVWTATGRNAFWEIVDMLSGPMMQHPDGEYAEAEEIGLISKL